MAGEVMARLRGGYERILGQQVLVLAAAEFAELLECEGILERYYSYYDRKSLISAKRRAIDIRDDFDLDVSETMRETKAPHLPCEPQVFLTYRLRLARLACLNVYREFVDLNCRGGAPLLVALRAYLGMQRYIRDRFFGEYKDFEGNYFRYCNGVLHSFDGPAVKWADDEELEYWVHGTRYASILHILCGKGDSVKPPALCPHFQSLDDLRRPVTLLSPHDAEGTTRVRIRLTENRIVKMFEEAARRRNGALG